MSRDTRKGDRMAKRSKPKMGDALVVNYVTISANSIMVAVLAQCECGNQTYTAVSGTPEQAKRLIYRKHAKHLKTCVRQAELFALDWVGDLEVPAEPE